MGSKIRRSKGRGSTSSITALRNGVDLKHAGGGYLLKKGDRADYDCNILDAVSSSSKRRLQSLVGQGVIRIDIYPGVGSPEYVQEREKEAEAVRERERLEAEAEAQRRLARLQSVSSVKPEPEPTSSVSETESLTSDQTSSEPTESTSVFESSEELDIEALTDELTDKLVSIHGVSRTTVRRILELRSWNRADIDGIPYMRSENVSLVIDILAPYRRAFGK